MPPKQTKLTNTLERINKEIEANKLYIEKYKDDINYYEYVNMMRQAMTSHQESYNMLIQQHADKQNDFAVEIRVNELINNMPTCFNVRGLPGYININYHKTFGNAKMMYFELLQRAYANHRMNVYFHIDLINNIQYQYTSSSRSVIQINTDNIKLKDFYEPKLCFDIKNSRNRIIVIKINELYFVFDSETLTINALKFIKKISSINPSHLSFNNEQIDTTSKLINIFQTVNTQNVIEFNVIKLKQKIIDTEHKQYGSIYLIRTREFSNQNIFKIGKTENNIDKRLGQYGKGGEVIFTIAGNINEISGHEQQLINIFMSKFPQKTEIGAEYFEGDCRDMIRIIYEYMFDKI